MNTAMGNDDASTHQNTGFRSLMRNIYEMRLAALGEGGAGGGEGGGGGKRQVQPVQKRNETNDGLKSFVLFCSRFPRSSLSDLSIWVGRVEGSDSIEKEIVLTAQTDGFQLVRRLKREEY